VTVDHRALIQTLADVMGRNNWDALPKVFAPDAVLEFPQSGEVFRGITNIRAQFEEYPGGLAESRIDGSMVVAEEPAYALTPTYTVVAIQGTGTRGTATFHTRYPDGSLWWAINLYETVEGRISHAKVVLRAGIRGARVASAVPRVAHELNGRRRQARGKCRSGRMPLARPRAPPKAYVVGQYRAALYSSSGDYRNLPRPKYPSSASTTRTITTIQMRSMTGLLLRGRSWPQMSRRVVQTRCQSAPLRIDLPGPSPAVPLAGRFGKSG
jgi:hypothetical protein